MNSKQFVFVTKRPKNTANFSEDNLLKINPDVPDLS